MIGHKSRQFRAEKAISNWKGWAILHLVWLAHLPYSRRPYKKEIFMKLLSPFVALGVLLFVFKERGLQPIQ
jgi:hypothetical protein